MSADPAIYDGMTFYRGASFTRTFAYKDADENPIDLTGYTGEFRARANLDASENVLDFTTSPGLILGGTAGTIALTVSATQTAAIEQDELVYSLTITSGSTVTPLLIGNIPVKELP